MRSVTPIFLILSIFLFGNRTSAQNFMQPTAAFSLKKVAYLTLADGTKLEGQFKSGQRAMNGGFKWINFKPTDGDKMKLQAEEIASLLVAESALSKMSEASNMFDATTWGQDVKINEEAVKEGYAYLETVVIAKKKKEVTALRQILNPGYSDEIKVMENAAGGSGVSTSVGGIKVAGGNAKSYVLKVGDEKAIIVKSGKYEELFEQLYGSCSEFMEKYSGEVKWKDIEEHVFAFSQMCTD